MPALDSFERVDLFRGLPASGLEALAALGTPQHVDSGRILFELGTQAETFYVVQEGRIDLTMPIELFGHPEDAFMEEVNRGGMLGWSALVPPNHYTMSARVAVDGEVLAWKGAAVRELMARDKDLAVVLLDNLSAIVGQRLSRMQALWIRELQRTLSTKLK